MKIDDAGDISSVGIRDSEQVTQYGKCLLVPPHQFAFIIMKTFSWIVEAWGIDEINIPPLVIETKDTQRLGEPFHAVRDLRI
jgi:hypothetical protein